VPISQRRSPAFTLRRSNRAITMPLNTHLKPTRFSPPAIALHNRTCAASTSHLVWTRMQGTSPVASNPARDTPPGGWWHSSRRCSPPLWPPACVCMLCRPSLHLTRRARRRGSHLARCGHHIHPCSLRHGCGAERPLDSPLVSIPSDQSAIRACPA
jgi:hypothetical protein